MSADFHPGSAMFASAPRAMLEREEFCSELVRSLVNALNIRGGDVFPGVGQPRDFNGADKECIGWRNGAIARADGFVDVSAPLYGGELESRPEYSRVHFRASLTVTVVQGDECGDGRSDDSTQKSSG